MKSTIKDAIKDNAGSTMTEVLVGFALLMIILGSLTQIIKISTNMLMRSKDIRVEQSNFQSEYFKDNYGSLEKNTIVPASEAGIVLEQVDKNGNAMAYGTDISLNKAEIISVYDSVTSTRIYQFKHSGE